MRESDLKLISDIGADLTGSFFIPNPNNVDYPRFEVGTKTFTLVNDPDNDQDNATTIAEEAYTAAGTLETVQENIIAVRKMGMSINIIYRSMSSPPCVSNSNIWFYFWFF